jgi:predicted RND superfamily exporter protein
MLGIAASTFLALVGIPAVLGLLPLPGRQQGKDRAPDAARHGILDRALVSLAGSVARRSRLAIGVWIVLGAGSLAALPSIEVDTDYLSYFAIDDPLRQDFEAINRLLAGVVPIYVVIDGRGAGSFREPELAKAVDELESRLSALPAVSRTLSFNDMLGRLNRAFHGDDPEEERVPDTRGAITELLFMLPKDELSSFLTVDHSRANVIVRTGAVGSSALIELERQLQAVLDTNPLPLGAQARITGNAILLAHSADAITRAQPRSVGIAAVAIFVLISIALRSPRLGAVAMIPNLVPVLIFFGLLGIGLAPLSLPVSLIGSMALGIAIDDSVHFLVRYQRERRRGAGPPEAALACSRHVGRPIAITSVMLCLGFLVVTGSRFATLQEFGLLSALTMGVCLATDLILLPAVLMRLRV